MYYSEYTESFAGFFFAAFQNSFGYRLSGFSIWACDESHRRPQYSLQDWAQNKRNVYGEMQAWELSKCGNSTAPPADLHVHCPLGSSWFVPWVTFTAYMSYKYTAGRLLKGLDNRWKNNWFIKSSLISPLILHMKSSLFHQKYLSAYENRQDYNFWFSVTLSFQTGGDLNVVSRRDGSKERHSQVALREV